MNMKSVVSILLIAVLTGVIILAGCTQPQTPVVSSPTPVPTTITSVVMPVTTTQAMLGGLNLSKEQVLRDVKEKGFPVYYGGQGKTIQVSGISEDEYKLYLYYMNITS